MSVAFHFRGAALALAVVACEGTIGPRPSLDGPAGVGGGPADVEVASDMGVSSSAPDLAPSGRSDGGESADLDLGTRGDAGIADVGHRGDAGVNERVPVFVAQGHMGRTTVSCDLGRSWTADRSNADGPVCASMDCDHDPGAGRGVVYGDDWFFATFGWGPAGQVFRSRDGIDWTAVSEDTTYAGLAIGNGRLLGGGKWGARLWTELGERGGR